MKDRKYTPIQIIGTQRSGSNLLRLMLNQLDGVIAPHPPHILKTFNQLLSGYGDLSIEENFRQLISDVCRLIKTNPVVWEHINLDQNHIFQLCNDRTLQEIFRVVYELMAEANGATHWCCKSMANVKFADELEAGNIKPYYIHLVRDGRDVAASFKKVAVGEKHVYHLAKYWKNLQEASASLVKKVGPSRAITIKYEDLIHDPEASLDRICKLVGLSYSPNVMNYFDSEESKHTASSGFMWENLSKPIIKNNTKKYKSALSPYEIDLFEKIAGDLLMAFEYQLEENVTIDEISAADISLFESENARLKLEILKQDHVKVDLFKRKEQEALIDSIKFRFASKIECA